jgi:predicted ATPase
MPRVGVCRLSRAGVIALQQEYRKGRWSNVEAFCADRGVHRSVYFDLTKREKWFEMATIEDKLQHFGIKDAADKNYYEYRDFAPKPLTNLPVPTTSFIGRESEIAEVKQWLTSTRLLTLIGSGGCGKTRLSLQVAADLLNDYSDGVWLVELASLSNPAAFISTVVSALGLSEERNRPLIETLIDYLKPKMLLLVLDNCEHLKAACASLAHTLLRSCPQVKILATSREALQIMGETVWRVPSLLRPDPNDLFLGTEESILQLIEYDAVRLFVERARAQRTDFALNKQNGRAVAAVCHRLDGIPLALELAAAWMSSMTVGQIALHLDDCFGLLTRGNATALPRQQTLRALIDWSYELLNNQEKILLQRLSVFVGGWTLEAAEAVCGGDGIVVGRVLHVLTSLVDKSLVVFEEREEEGRYHFLETIRQYARERLAKTEEAQALGGRHRNHFLALAEMAEPQLTGAEQARWLERLEVEHDNLREALAWCKAEEGGAEAGLRLAGALWRFWWVRGYLSDGWAYLAKALERSGAFARTPARAKALSGAGNLVWNQGDYGTARTLYEESLAIRRELGDKLGIAASLGNLGVMAYEQGDYGAARTLYEEGLAIRRELGDKLGIAASLGNLGVVAFYQGDYGAARTLDEESLAIQRELGDKGGIANSLICLGLVAYMQGEYGSARTLYEESLAIKRELGDKLGIAALLGNLGSVAHKQGGSGAARTLYEESMAILRELGDKRVIAYLLEGFADLAKTEGQAERAARLWGAAEALREAIGSPIPPNEREMYKRNVTATREAFAAAWADGGAMTIEQAIEYALKDRMPTGSYGRS